MERWLWVAVLALAAVVPVVVSSKVFPDGSPNRDEAGYLSQASALRAGELTLPASTHDPSFRPFLSSVEGDRVIFKYQPAWPALIAASEAITGTTRGALVVTGVAATLAVAALAHEVSGRRRVALLAAAIFACSPWFVVQSGTYLAYPASAAVLAGATAVVLRAVRTGHRGLLVVGGALFGLGLFHRPFDALLAGIPVLAWLIARRRRTAAPVVPDLVRIGLGAAPLLVLTLAYNVAISGSPFRFALSVTGPIDTFGFGERSSFLRAGQPLLPGQGGPFDFTPGEAWRTVIAFGGTFDDWLLGGVLAIVLAGLGLRWAPRRGRAWLVAAQGLIVPVGYFFWWGAANARAYQLHKLLGPIYWFALLVTFAVLGAIGVDGLATRLVDARQRRRSPAGTEGGQAVRAPRGAVGAVAGAIVVGLLVVSAATSVDTRTSLRNVRDDRRAEVALLAAPPGGGRTVTVAPRQYPGDPYVPVPVPATFDGDHLVAMDPSGGWGRFDLLDALPGRTMAEVVPTHSPGGIFEPPVRVRTELSVRSGASVELVAAAAGDPTYVRLKAEDPDGVEGARRPLALDDGELRVSVTPEGGGGDVEVPAGPPVEVVLGVDGFELHWLARVDPNDAGRVQVIDPPRQVRRYAFEGRRPVEVVEDVSAFIRPA